MATMISLVSANNCAEAAGLCVPPLPAKESVWCQGHESAGDSKESHLNDVICFLQVCMDSCVWINPESLINRCFNSFCC